MFLCLSVEAAYWGGPSLGSPRASPFAWTSAGPCAASSSTLCVLCVSQPEPLDLRGLYWT